METVRFRSTDVGEVEQFLSATYSTMRIAAADGPIQAEVTRRVISSQLEFHELDYSFDLTYDAEPARWLFVCDVISNTLHPREHGGAEESFGPGDQFLVIRPDLPYAGVVRSPRYRFAALDPALLSQLVAGEEDVPAEPVRMTGTRPVSRDAQARLQRCIAYLRDDVLHPWEGDISPLLVASATHLLAATVLQTYPNTALVGPTAADRRDGRPTALARAVAFIETHPDQPLSLADIARAAYVTPRALQIAFRTHLRTTPMGYLRRVRLDHARRTLLDASPGSVTVTAVAARWGFSPSRFSQLYRAAYGEPPHRTLRR
ncbi:MAG: helix-turn-helix domain-containing protein [Nocardioides sp.]|uniref:helix-turn-helix transcriptional regulator n=1 Tax=Nocardioides sp. TaxID=35761 RepID=UPI0039E6DBAC